MLEFIAEMTTIDWEILRETLLYSAPVQQSSAVDLVSERIRGAIALGILRDGDRLPTEQALRAQFGVGIATIRTAIAVLRGEGLVETQRGVQGGSFIANSASALSHTARRSKSSSINDLHEAAVLTEAIESKAAELAATHATPAQRAQLRAIVAAIDLADDRPDLYHCLNNAFHISVACASGNRLLEQQAITLRAREQQLIAALIGRIAPVRLAQDEHWQMIKAFERGDADGARALMSAHHRGSLPVLLTGINEDGLRPAAAR